MPKNKIEDLRNLLFETMEKLMDEDDPMDIKRADAIGNVAQVIVNSAKVEVDFVKITGHGGTAFIGNGQPDRPQLVANVINITPDERHEDLCQKCTLPDCDETSVNCLVQIQKKAA